MIGVPVVGGIPIPKKVSGNEKYKIDHMNVGDSFRYDGTSQGARALIGSKRKTHPGWNFISRRLKNGSVRIWRVK